tara:strand:- start:4452 stop:4577 length:126 start_codon:yes stop_codon:yes gene_type:complete
MYRDEDLNDEREGCRRYESYLYETKNMVTLFINGNYYNILT